MLLLFSFLLVLEPFALSQNGPGPSTWTAAPFNAPSFPLAVKTPYVNAWDPQGSGPAPVSNSWARVGSTVFTVSISPPCDMERHLIKYATVAFELGLRYHSGRHPLSNYGRAFPWNDNG